METCPSLPGLGVNKTEHEPLESKQAEGLKVPEWFCENLTLPEGVEGVPPPTSETWAVQIVFEFTGTTWGEHVAVVVVGRFDTSSVKLPELPA